VPPPCAGGRCRRALGAPEGTAAAGGVHRCALCLGVPISSPLVPQGAPAMGLAAVANQPRPTVDAVLRGEETSPPRRRRIQPREHSRMGGHGGHGRRRRRGVVAGDVAVEEEARRRCRRRSPVATSRRWRLCWGMEVPHDVQAWRRRLDSSAGTTSTVSLVVVPPFHCP